MLKFGKLVTLAILGTLAISPAFAEEKSVAMVNGVSIPQSRVDLMVKIATTQGQPDSSELRKAIREDVINLELLVQEAKKNGLDKDAEITQQIDRAQQSVLGSAYLQKYAQEHPVGEEQLTQEYDRLKASLGSSEYEARHILVETEDEAKAIIARLGKKAKFDKIAKEKSKDAGSAERGGSLGWAVPGSFVAPFSNALLKLKKGEYTKEPVQSQYGWHIIKLDNIRDLKMPAFEELKPQMKQRLQQQIMQNLIADLRGKAKIE